MQEEVKIIRLFSGELVIGRVGNTTYIDTLNNPTNNPFGPGLTIKDPIRIAVVPNKIQGQAPTIGLMPWNEFSSDKQVTINPSYIISVETPIGEFVSQYRSLTSGLMLPQTSGLSTLGR